MGSREKWVAAAREVTGHDVQDAVPLVRRKPQGWTYLLVGGLLFAPVVLLDEFGLVPGPRLVAYFLGALAMSLVSLRQKNTFAKMLAAARGAQRAL